MGSLLAARHGEGSLTLLFPTLTLAPAILLWWIAPTIHLNYVTSNELSVQSGPNEPQGLFLLTLPQHSLLLLITVRACGSEARGWSPLCRTFSVCVCVCERPYFHSTLQLLRGCYQRMRTLNLHSATVDCCYMNPDTAVHLRLIRWNFKHGANGPPLL